MAKFLFTTLPTNDLGLLARSLPVALELSRAGHDIVFCSPAAAPAKLVAEAGFDNRVPRHALYYLMAGSQTPRGLYRSVKAFGLGKFLGQV